MAKKGVIALTACVFALCLALVGCGTSSSESNKSAFTGTWDLVEMEQDGEVTNSDDLEKLKSLGLEVYVNLNEDGTVALVLFGEPMEGTWEATSATAGTLTLKGQQVNMTIEDSKLKFAQEGASLTFQKGEAKEVPSKSESESASSSEASGSAAVFGDPDIVNVTSGGGSSIGTNAIFHAAKADCTLENLTTWYNEYVKNSADNWCVIVFTDDDAHGVYANAGMVQMGVGLDKQTDGSYMLGDDSGATFYVYDSDASALKEKN